MGQLRYSDQAREDLLSVWAGIALHSESAADRVIDLIYDRCALLRDHPRLGPERPDIAEGARALIVEKWIAFYRVIEGGVQIVLVVDGRRDHSRLEWLTS